MLVIIIDTDHLGRHGGYFLQSLARLQKQLIAPNKDAQFERPRDLVLGFDVGLNGLNSARQSEWYGARRLPWQLVQQNHGSAYEGRH